MITSLAARANMSSNKAWVLGMWKAEVTTTSLRQPAGSAWMVMLKNALPTYTDGRA